MKHAAPLITLAILAVLTHAADGRVYVRPLAGPAGPTPRPTTVVFSSANSSACGLTDRYFGIANCNANYTAVDWTPIEDGTFTNMTCSQPTDSSCSATYTLYINSGSPVSGFSCLSVNTAPCSPASPPPTSFTVAGNLVAIHIEDTGGDCAANAPTCVVEYTVP